MSVSDTIIQILNMLQHATLSLPAIEISALLVILTVCLLFKFVKIGLVGAYLFTYRWGWMVFAVQHEQKYLVGYLVFGMVAGILAVIGMLHSKS